MFEDIEIALSVNAWNLVVSSISVLSFPECTEILDIMKKQTEGNEAKGEETVKITLSPTHINEILGVLQLLPYHVSNSVINDLYTQTMTVMVDRQAEKEKKESEKAETEAEKETTKK